MAKEAVEVEFGNLEEEEEVEDEEGEESTEEEEKSKCITFYII